MPFDPFVSWRDKKPVCKRKLVVIITGDPKYIHDPQLVPLVEAFYTEIGELVLAKGFHVEFDKGDPYTHPDRYARVWIAHDRGVQRRRHVSDNTIFIQLETASAQCSYPSDDERRRSKEHYTLSERDRIVLDALLCEE